METKYALKKHKEIFLEKRGISKGNVKYVRVNPTLRLILKPLKQIIKKVY